MCVLPRWENLKAYILARKTLTSFQSAYLQESKEWPSSPLELPRSMGWKKKGVGGRQETIVCNASSKHSRQNSDKTLLWTFSSGIMEYYCRWVKSVPWGHVEPNSQPEGRGAQHCFIMVYPLTLQREHFFSPKKSSSSPHWLQWVYTKLQRTLCLCSRFQRLLPRPRLKWNQVVNKAYCQWCALGFYLPQEN